MTRGEMVEQFNYYTRKRNQYAEKIEENNKVKSILEASLLNCTASMKKIEQFKNDSVLFSALYEKNDSYFNETETNRILGVIENLGAHLERERSTAQKNINKWYSEIKAYDREQE